ncbi:hypothetical protein [Paraburkholderia sediminicola]|uniref:hypothetical protein n=1 Tax=Paraburkholderia sediminicola TaxID=458836 RepID=UPI00158205A9|nr:hypothetical protein [Paraburkholderia sediminicola]
MTFERIIRARQDRMLERFRRHGAARFGTCLAILFDRVAQDESGCVGSALALVDLDFFVPRQGFVSAFRFERFCYTLPSLA